MSIAEEIGINLKCARKSVHKTQSEVASLMFMTQQQYSRFENGKFQLNYEQILNLCTILDTTPNEIFSVKDNKFD